MKEIKYTAERIREELEDAEHYAMKALKFKDKDSEMARTLETISKQELGHVEMLHGQAERLIREQRSKGIEAPASMQAVWDWEHEHLIAKKADVLRILDMLRQ